MAVELEERRLDLAERNIYEALKSDDSRRRDAASFFVVRNSHRARRRGWIASSTGAAELSVNTSGPAPVMLWREDDPDKRAAQVAQIKRLEEEGKRVITIGWRTSDDPDDDKTIEHQPVAKD